MASSGRRQTKLMNLKNPTRSRFTVTQNCSTACSLSPSVQTLACWRTGSPVSSHFTNGCCHFPLAPAASVLSSSARHCARLLATDDASPRPSTLPLVCLRPSWRLVRLVSTFHSTFRRISGCSGPPLVCNNSGLTSSQPSRFSGLLPNSVAFFRRRVTCCGHHSSYQLPTASTPPSAPRVA